MGSNRPSPATFLLSLISILLLEWLVGGALTSSGRLSAAGVLAVVRSLELMSLVLIVRLNSGSLAAVGLDGAGVPAGLAKGLRWSIGLGIIGAGGWLAAYRWGWRPSLMSPDATGPAKAADVWWLAVVLGPAVEELFFRGILYGFFRRWGIVAAIGTSSLSFAFAHSPITGFPVLPLIGGLLLAFIYEMDGHLLSPLTVHVLGNLVWFHRAWWLGLGLPGLCR